MDVSEKHVASIFRVEGQVTQQEEPCFASCLQAICSSETLRDFRPATKRWSHRYENHKSNVALRAIFKTEIEAAHSYETSVSGYKRTLCHIPKTYPYENVKTFIYSWASTN
jgi:hypothetical protein